MRYVMRIAELSESSNLWTQIAVLGSPETTPRWVSVLLHLHGVPFIYKRARSGGIMNVSLHSESLEESRVLTRTLRTENRKRHLVNSLMSLILQPSCLFPHLCELPQGNKQPARSILLGEANSGLENRSQLKREYPVDLSILLTGGKETNKDSPSNGEWSGKSSKCKSVRFGTSNCNLETYCQRVAQL